MSGNSREASIWTPRPGHPPRSAPTHEEAAGGEAAVGVLLEELVQEVHHLRVVRLERRAGGGCGGAGLSRYGPWTIGASSGPKTLPHEPSNPPPAAHCGVRRSGD